VSPVFGRRPDNPQPFSKMIVAASRTVITRDERRQLEYTLRGAERTVARMVNLLETGRAVRRGDMATRLDVLSGDLGRCYTALLTAELADRQAREEQERKAEEAAMDRLRREWNGDDPS